MLGSMAGLVVALPAEYRCHGKARLTGSGLSALLIAVLRGPACRPPVGRPESPAFRRGRVRGATSGATDPRPRFRAPRCLSTQIRPALDLATNAHPVLADSWLTLASKQQSATGVGGAPAGGRTQPAPRITRCSFRPRATARLPGDVAAPFSVEGRSVTPAASLLVEDERGTPVAPIVCLVLGDLATRCFAAERGRWAHPAGSVAPCERGRRVYRWWRRHGCGRVTCGSATRIRARSPNRKSWSSRTERIARPRTRVSEKAVIPPACGP